MNEREIVARLRKQAPLIGDDCAILPNGRTDLVVTTDQFIEDVHFRRSTHSAADCGWTALARGLSDLAAMGAKPLYSFVSIALPDWARMRWLNGFYRGFHQLAQKYQVQLAGGDLAHASALYCDVTVIGEVPRGRALVRSGANVGDMIYVSGALGKPAHRPSPRIEIGQSLRSVASACMDITDGLSRDLARLCEASDVGADLEDIPLARGATIEDAFHRGEDYELLFTSARRLNHPVIGKIVERRGVRWRGRPLKAKGYDHFARKDS